MKKATWVALSCVAGAIAIGACSSTSGSGVTQAASDTGSGGSAGMATSSSTGSSSSSTGSSSSSSTGSSSSSSSSGSTSSSSSSASSSSGGSNLVNGCDPTTATDMTGSTTVTITFPMGVNLVYTPACIKVKTGTMVTFSGNFSFHPLAGGNNPPTVDTTSPIMATSTGTTATFTIANAGSFGFFCQNHFASGMKGAIFAQ